MLLRQSIHRIVMACLVVVLCAAPTLAQDQAAMDRLLERIVDNERDFLQFLQKSQPIVETYIQEVPAATDMDAPPRNDHYFLGRMSVTGEVTYESLIEREDGRRRSRPAPAAGRVSFLPRGFAQMTVIDAAQFDRQTYRFQYVRREFLGEVRCLVLDVAPADARAAGRFIGRIWVEDREFRIVRFNGTYTSAPKGSRWRFFSGASNEIYYHFDSWRVQVAPGRWTPAFVYIEEGGEEDASRPRFKGQTRIWGFQVSLAKVDELTRVLIESETRLNDQSGTRDVSPLESQRNWERQAEENVVERLEKAGLLAPPGDVDKVLNTVVNNLIVTNNLGVAEVRCRVLLTTPLETFSMGQTIVISRGLVDVLPDEASLAMVLAGELAHIALGHRTETSFAFHDQTMAADTEVLRRFRFERPADQMSAAARKAIEFLKNSPYKDKLANAGLFLKALQSRAPHLPRLIQANLGNQLASGEHLARFSELVASAPALAEGTLDQIAALPLGSRIKVDPWSARITMVKTRPVALLSAREKMPFEVTPVVIHLTRGETPANPVQARQE